MSCVKTNLIGNSETRRIAEVGLGEGDKCEDGEYQIQTTLIRIDEVFANTRKDI